MSIKTWKKEFYPIEADRTKKKDAIQHSLTKWIGLQKSNLKKHGLKYTNFGIADKKISLKYTNDEKMSFDVDSDSCSLCFHYWGQGENTEFSHVCEKCPIYLTTNKSCNEDSTENSAEYPEFLDSDNPKPMIKLLKRVLKEHG